MEDDVHEAEPRGMTMIDLGVLVAGFAVAFVLLMRIRIRF